MKANNKKIYRIVCMCALFFISATYYSSSGVVKDLMTRKRLKSLPVTYDFRNYFILQSIKGVTNVIIGDFVSNEQVICVIQDKNNDEKPDEITQYYPTRNKYSFPKKPTTELYQGFKETKEEIISGAIFKKNYAYKMGSLDILKSRIKRGEDIHKRGFGYVVSVFDPDTKALMNEFYFARKEGGFYDLQFRTLYYKLYSTKIVPPIAYSVYCKNSKDPAVKKTVDELLKLYAE